jgi:hypothetical protein
MIQHKRVRWIDLSSDKHICKHNGKSTSTVLMLRRVMLFWGVKFQICVIVDNGKLNRTFVQVRYYSAEARA